MAYMRLFAELPGVTLSDTESFWFVSNQPAPGNIILRSRLNTSHIEERIDALLEQIGQYSDHIDWLVFPDDQHADLGKRLEARILACGNIPGTDDHERGLCHLIPCACSQSSWNGS